MVTETDGDTVISDQGASAVFMAAMAARDFLAARLARPNGEAPGISVEYEAIPSIAVPQLGEDFLVTIVPETMVLAPMTRAAQSVEVAIEIAVRRKAPQGMDMTDFLAGVLAVADKALTILSGETLHRGEDAFRWKKSQFVTLYSLDQAVQHGVGTSLVRVVYEAAARQTRPLFN